jgi:pyruvate formate lyase activating enzyme
MIMTSGVDYEFRTTVVPGLVDSEDILDIGSYISGAKRYVLQQFIPSKAYLKEYRKIVPYDKRILDSFKEKLELFKIEEILIKNV